MWSRCIQRVRRCVPFAGSVSCPVTRMISDFEGRLKRARWSQMKHNDLSWMYPRPGFIFTWLRTTRRELHTLIRTALLIWILFVGKHIVEDGEWNWHGLIALLFSTPIRLDVSDGEYHAGDVEEHSSDEFPCESEDTLKLTPPEIDHGRFVLRDYRDLLSAEQEIPSSNTVEIPCQPLSSGSSRHIIDKESM